MNNIDIQSQEIGNLLKQIPMRTIIDNMQGGLCVFEIDDELRYLYVNDGFFSMLGYAREEYFELMADGEKKLFSMSDKKKALGLVQQSLRTGETVDFDYHVLDKDGNRQCHHLRGLPLQVAEYEKPIFIAIITDVTEIENTRTLLEKQYRKTQRMYKREMRYLDGISQAIPSSLKVNLTTGIIEFHRSNLEGAPFCQENVVYEESLEKILECLGDEEERDAFRRCFSRDKLLTLFEAGEREAEMEYRRKTGENEFLWVRTYMKLLRDPDSDDVIGVAYTRNAENEKSRMTTSRMLLNQLHVATDQLYVYVMALDFNDYTYDVIQEDHKQAICFPMHGDIADLVSILYGCYHPDSYEYLDTIKSLPNMMAKFVSRNELNYEAKIFRNGREIWYRHKIIPVENEKGKHPYYLVMTLDITHDKVAEAELKNALLEAKAAGKAKQDFLAHMSHEMRTPLNGIKGILDIMHQRPELAHDRMLDDAIMSVNHLSGLINDVLDMAKIESGSIELRRNIMSFEELQEYLHSIIAPMADEKGITYTCICSREMPYIFADTGRVKQVLINLLTNAVKYTRPGGRVDYRCEYRTLDKDRIRISMVIEDNGIGMSAEFLKSAFVPFERAEVARALYSGTGLGLPITKSLVDLMHGGIEIESEPEHGTRVTVTLDADVVDESSESFARYQQCIAETGLETILIQGKHVLLVEDNTVNMEIAEYNLMSMGLTCDKAYDGEEALEKYLNMPAGNYDIIFTDIMMPKKDGLMLAKEIRTANRPDSKTIPIVAMTANAFTEDITKSMESGMNYHLSKPFDIKDMRGILVKEFSTR